jgi:hypothetical protein
MVTSYRLHQACTIRYNGLSNVVSSQIIVTNIYNSKSAIFNAVWDTGAMRTTISQNVVNTIECIATDKATMIAVGGEPEEVNVYDVALKLPNNVNIKRIPVLSTSKIGACDILIGMDIIMLGDFAITNVDGITVMSFSMPSYKTIDFFARAEKLNKPIFKKIKKSKPKK